MGIPNKFIIEKPLNNSVCKHDLSVHIRNVEAKKEKGQEHLSEVFCFV